MSPEKTVWIYSMPRSGSTWLRTMLQDLLPCEVWEEPKVSQLFGEFYEKAQTAQLASTDFVLGDPTRRVWVSGIRRFVLDAAWASNPTITLDRFLVVKEPGGGLGAPLIAQALPESRMVFLVRDPRDVVASVLDAQKEGGWMHEGTDEAKRGRKVSANSNENAYVRVLSNRYLRQISSAKRAYEAHPGPKVLVRYEDLRDDVLETLRTLRSVLGLPIEDGDLLRAAEKHAWERVPKSEKGEGKFFRKGSPGGWRDDLTPKQAAIIEEVTAPLIAAYYA